MNISLFNSGIITKYIPKIKAENIPLKKECFRPNDKYKVSDFYVFANVPFFGYHNYCVEAFIVFQSIYYHEFQMNY